MVAERVEIRLGPSHLRRLDSIVDSLILPDLTTVVWAPHGHDEAIDALRGLADVVLLDSMDQPDMRAAVKRVSGLAEHVYVVDLAWLRSTPWRERIAATLDPDQWRPALRKITRVVIRHRPDSAVSGVLLLGWFASRLGWEPGSLVQENGRHHARATAGKLEVKVDLEPVPELGAPGLAGIVLETAEGLSLSLDRARGGLARQAPHPRRQGDELGGARRLARRGGHPRRGHPPGAAARPHVRARRDVRRGVPLVSEPDIQVVEDPAAVVAKLLVEAAGAGRHIVLTGGSTPKLAYELAAEMEADWSRATFWFGDERCVPPEHEHSNYGMAAKALLSRIQPAAVERMRGELGPDAGARDYEGRLHDAFGDGIPELDLLLLGLGPDAHTASLFPGDAALGERERHVVGVETPGMAPLVARISLTLPVINAAREVIFLVTGEDKAEAVARAFGGPAARARGSGLAGAPRPRHPHRAAGRSRGEAPALTKRA